MKNYYEILEVDKKASPEVIEKAYKTLVKKYHPDLQNENNHSKYEAKMKEINEAYSILSDDFKKSNYDEQLQQSDISVEKYNKLVQENQNLRAQLENINQQNTINSTTDNNTINDNVISKMSKLMYNNIKQARAQAYNDAYLQDMKNRGYKIEYKHDLKYYFKLIIYIAIIVLIGILIYQIPPVKSYFTSLYNGNVYFKAIVDIFKNTIQSGF